MQQNQPLNAKKMYPISVDYVFKTDYDPTDATIKLICDYCVMMDIKFRLRKFDSMRFVEDKALIEKLPAVHVYIKNVHAAISYPEDNPLQPLCAIRDVYDTFDVEYTAYLSKKQIWNERLRTLKRMFSMKSSKTDLSQSNHT